MVWGLMLLLVLLDEYSALLVVCVCCKLDCWISMDIHGYRICGYPYPWISMDAVLCDHVKYTWISMYFSVLAPQQRVFVPVGWNVYG